MVFLNEFKINLVESIKEKWLHHGVLCNAQLQSLCYVLFRTYFRTSRLTWKYDPISCSRPFLSTRPFTGIFYPVLYWVKMLRWKPATFILVESYRDTCSCKGPLERTRSWEVLSWKVWSWKDPSEVGKNREKLERIERNWKVSFEVGKFRWSCTARTFQLCSELSNFNLSNFIPDFPTSIFPISFQTFQLQSFQFHSGLSNSSFFPTAFSNYTYPIISGLGC